MKIIHDEKVPGKVINPCPYIDSPVDEEVMIGSVYCTRGGCKFHINHTDTEVNCHKENMQNLRP
jgi:hypothetical protein